MRRYFYPIAITLLLALAGAGAWGAPSVSGFSGTASNGESVTITGSGFGSTGPTVFLFEDFENGTDGNSISASDTLPIGSWHSVKDGNSVYASTHAMSGSLSALMDYTTINGGSIYANLPANVESFFVVYNWYVPSDSDFPGDSNASNRNFKHVWLYRGQGGCVGDCVARDDITSVQLPGWNFKLLSNHETVGGGGPMTVNDSINISGAEDKGEWHRVAWYVLRSGTTTANGKLKAWQDGMQTQNSTNEITVEADGNYWNTFSVFGFGRTNGGVKAQAYFDDIYIAVGTSGEEAQARVEIGDNATYADCTILSVVTPTSWSDTSITGNFRSGEFTGGETGYVFVTHADGTRNSTGYSVTIGSASGGSAPGGSAPGGSAPGGSASRGSGLSGTFTIKGNFTLR